MDKEDPKTITQVHNKLKSHPDYNIRQKRIVEISGNPYYIPTLNEVREMVMIGGWFSLDYTDIQIQCGLDLVKRLDSYHKFLVERDGNLMPSYDIPGTFIFGPLAEYINNLYVNNDQGVKKIFVCLMDLLVIPKHTSDNSYQLIESFLDNLSFDDISFRERFISDFPDGVFKEYLTHRLKEIYTFGV